MAITKRVTKNASPNTTKRLDFSGRGSIYDAWADAWGSTWGLTWLVHLALGAIGHTPRVDHVSIASLTLSGDMRHGEILLQGDATDGDDVLLLSGDVVGASTTITKRVTGV